ncbi:MAG TPA: antibiotic biosynthesis monooxygenase [Chitinophagales bacterium]|nr:antibiotic biosynthesis monooxygenase [Chitinophagales bacterium]HMU97662.1 antibiotic biosynthesis monooxygenase [Chitinophagales bacterium]HMV01928.1 antibiotic biosynthesis monooxygenase [Chitinophagales bacterium]HMW93866.1 antibiotic biosynthesis monooxygenase [Chitinophagales bacterium]HMY42074.1 antibiotic biosynthesis monooxygenase [Chitinophagales bacterium]
MILEAFTLKIKAEQTVKFEENFLKASEIINKSKGYIKHELHACKEIKNQYLLMIYWETYENHMIDFRNSEGFKEWRALLQDFYDELPTVLHYDRVVYP